MVTKEIERMRDDVGMELALERNRLEVIVVNDVGSTNAEKWWDIVEKGTCYYNGERRGSLYVKVRSESQSSCSCIIVSIGVKYNITFKILPN